MGSPIHTSIAIPIVKIGQYHDQTLSQPSYLYYTVFILNQTTYPLRNISIQRCHLTCVGILIINTVSLRESPFLPVGFPTRYKTSLTFIMEMPTHGSTVLKFKHPPVSIANMYPYTWRYILYINSLAQWKFEWNFRHVISKQIIVIDGWGICCEIALVWMSLDFSGDQSTLIQVMAWCRQAPSHYLSQCWLRSL